MFAAARRPAARLATRQLARFSSSQVPPNTGGAWARRAKAGAKYTGLFTLSTVGGVGALAGGILIHDAFTYNEKHADRVPVHPLALSPERGGPKNLPVVRIQVDDEEDDEAKRLLTRPKLVIVGAGWGVRAFSSVNQRSI